MTGTEHFTVCIDPDTLEKGGNNLITGKIMVKMGEYYFPDEHWNDFPVIILGWWLKQIVDSSDNNKHEYDFRLMDGPFHFTTECVNSNACNITFYVKDIVVGIGIVNIEALRKEISMAANKILRACRDKSFYSEDIKKLDVLFHRIKYSSAPGTP